MLGFGKNPPVVLPDPDGVIDSDDMYQFAYLYHGITLSGGVSEAGTENLFFWRSRRMRR